MQCPNCGKEALNVNGRYVCLDCGVEISPEAATTNTASETTNTVNNHTPVADGNVVISTVESEQPVQPEVAPVQVAPAEQAAPVESAYLNELNNSSAEPAETVGGGKVPDFPTSTAPAIPQNNPAEILASEVPAENLAELNTTAGSNPVNLFETPAAPQPTPEAAAAPENFFNPASIDLTNPTSAAAPANNLPEKEEAAMPVNTSPVADPIVEKTEEIKIPVVAEEAAANIMPTASAEVPETPTTSTPSLDDLLNQYSNTPTSSSATVAPSTLESNFTGAGFNSSQPASASVDSMSSGVQAGPANPQVTTPANNIPGSSSIPSAESVFGPQNQEPKIDVPQKAKIDSKKMMIYGGIVIAAIIFIAGAIAIGVNLAKSKAPTDPVALKQEQMLEYSELVGNAMDPNQNLVVSFNQSLDFTKATVKTVEGADPAAVDGLKNLFSTAILNNGNWSGNIAGDISLDSMLGSVPNKRIYIQSEKATYVFSAELNSWTKINDYQFTSVPPFYGVVNKGALFYTSKSDEISYVTDEDLEGVTYKKIKIKPKKEVFESLITGSGAALTTAKITEINSENLEIFAWINEEGKIHKVSVVGDLGVNADIFEGTVSVKSEATYEYKDVTIQKP